MSVSAEHPATSGRGGNAEQSRRARHRRGGREPDLAYHKQRLAEFDRLAVLDQNFLDDAGRVCIDFIQQFHCFDNAQLIAFFNYRANFDERR